MDESDAITSDDVRMVEFMAHLLLRNGQWEKALSLYDTLLRLEPGEPRKLLASCYLLLNLNRAEEALARLDWLLVNGPKAAADDTLILLRARALAALGRMDEARDWLRDPTHVQETHGW